MNGMTWLMGLLLVLQPQEGKDTGEKCNRALDSFRKAYGGADEAKRVDAVRELGKHRCPSCVGTLSALLASETEKVRIATAKVLGAFDDAKAVEAVAGAVGPNVNNHEVLEALAKSLEDLDWEVGATILNLLLQKHHDKDVLEALHVIVPVLGKLGSASSVEPLVKLLEHAENEGRRARVGGKKYAGNPRMAALKAPIDKALQQITGADQSSADKWDNWWKANRERLLASATVIYRCRATGKRWGQKAGEPQECPHHDKPEKDGQVVKTHLVGGKKP